MKLVQDLEEALEAIAESMNWKAVMHYEDGRLTGISMGTTDYIEESTGILWSLPTQETPRLRIVRNDK